MKLADDERSILRIARPQRGVLSTADLQNLLGEPHRAAFTRRVRALSAGGTLRRFSRGFYVHTTFDLPTLSQRLAPDSYVSFGTVLARELLVGSVPSTQLLAARPGPARTWRNLGHEIIHVHIARHLDFGHSSVEGVRWACAEKAVLDVLYFHLRGRRYPFDLWSDIDYRRLDMKRLRAFLTRYRNPKFVAFVERVIAGR